MVTPIRARLDQALFAPSDAVSAGVFRLMLAVMLALVFQPGRRKPRVDHELPGAEELYGSIFATDWYWLVILGLLLVFGAGLWPRMTGLLLVGALLPLVPVPGRQPGRQVLVFTLLAFSFLRSDSRLSLRGMLGAPSAFAPGPRWPVLLIRLQLALLYGVNALAKTAGNFLNGDVLVGLSRMLPNFSVDLSGGFVHLGFMAVPVWLAAVGTVTTEYALALGFWFRRLRLATAVLGILFHATLAQVVGINYLDVVAVFLYAAFLLPFDREASVRDR